MARRFRAGDMGRKPLSRKGLRSRDEAFRGVWTLPAAICKLFSFFVRSHVDSAVLVTEKPVWHVAPRREAAKIGLAGRCCYTTPAVDHPLPTTARPLGRRQRLPDGAGPIVLVHVAERRATLDGDVQALDVALSNYAGAGFAAGRRRSAQRATAIAASRQTGTISGARIRMLVQ